MDLTQDQIAQIERNRQEALARLERNKLLRQEQQYQQQQQQQQQSHQQQQHKTQQQKTQQLHQKGVNRDHYKQATLEEKQINARISYKTHQRTEIVENDATWVEKKKKDELLEDTEEYKLVQQLMSTNANDISMIVVPMNDPSIKKKITPNPRIVDNSNNVARNNSFVSESESYDEWSGLVSVIGRMNKAEQEGQESWVKKVTPKEEEDEGSNQDNQQPLSRNNSYLSDQDSNNPKFSPQPLSRSNSNNSDTDSKCNTNPSPTSTGNGNNNNSNINNNNNTSNNNNNNNSPKGRGIKNYFMSPPPFKASSLPSSPSSPLSSPSGPQPSATPKRSFVSSFYATSPSPPSSSSPSHSPSISTAPSPAPAPTPTPTPTPTPSPSPSPSFSSKSAASPAPSNKNFKKTTPSPSSSSSSSRASTPSKHIIQQKINFTSVTLNAKAEDEKIATHRIPGTVLQQGYVVMSSESARRAIMAPSVVDLKKKKQDGGRVWVCWSVLYGNGHTSFRKSASTPAKRKKVAPSVGKPDPLGVCFLKTSKANENPTLFVLPIGDKTTRKENMEFLLQFLEAEEVCKVCYNTQDSLKVVMEEFPTISPKNCLDPQIGAWVCNPESQRYVFQDMIHYFISKVSKFEKNSQATLMTSHELMAIDQHDCLALMDHLLETIIEDKLVSPLQDEMDLVPVLSKMEIDGIRFNSQVLEPCKEAITEKMETIKSEAENLISYSINFNSTQNVAHVLFDVLKLNVPTDKYSGKKFANTKKGNRSTSESILKKLESQHKLPSVILEYRHCQKLLSNWVDSLIGQTKVGQDGALRIHAHWLSNATSTGRLSSTDPNLQNIPKSRLTMGNITFHVRDSFCASEGWILVGADYSQIELRVLAHISKDPTLMSFFGEGVDVLKMVASHWMGKSVDEVTAEDRDYTKRIVYGILYGMGAPSLASMLKVSIAEASKFMSTFLGKFPLVKHFMDYTIEHAKQHLYVRTITGRLRRLPHINSGGSQKQQALRQAVNTVIQGTAADVVKAAMIGVNEILKRDERLFHSARLLLQIHDELVYEVKEEVADEFLEIMQNTMVSSLNLRVPLTLSVKKGKSWGSMTAVNPGATTEADESFEEEMEDELYNNDNGDDEMSVAGDDEDDEY